MLKNKEFKNFILKGYYSFLEETEEVQLEKVQNEYLMKLYKEFYVDTKDNFQHIYDRTQHDLYLDFTDFVAVGKLIAEARVKKYRKEKDLTYRTKETLVKYLLTYILQVESWLAYPLTKEELKSAEVCKFINKLFFDKKRKAFATHLETETNFKLGEDTFNLIELILAIDSLILNADIAQSEKFNENPLEETVSDFTDRIENE